MAVWNMKGSKLFVFTCCWQAFVRSQDAVVALYFCSNNWPIESINMGAQRESSWNIQTSCTNVLFCKFLLMKYVLTSVVMKGSVGHVSATMAMLWVFWCCVLWPVLSSGMLLQIELEKICWTASRSGLAVNTEHLTFRDFRRSAPPDTHQPNVKWPSEISSVYTSIPHSYRPVVHHSFLVFFLFSNSPFLTSRAKF